MADPNALYSYQGQLPEPLPDEIFWTEDWGQTTFRTDKTSFTKEEIKKAGYTGPYKIPSYNQEYQRVFWDSSKLKYTVEDIPNSDLWSQVRARRNQLLAESDWTMAADVPASVNFHEWEMYRQRLRDITTSCEDPKNVIWPESPEGKSDSDFDQPRVEEDSIRWRIKYLESIAKKYIQMHPEEFPEEFPTLSENSETETTEEPSEGE